MSKLFEEWEGEASTSFLNIWYWTSMYNCKSIHRTIRFRLSPSLPAALCDTSAQTSWGPRSSQSPPTQFPFQFVMSSSAEAKFLRSTISISEREPLRLARATQNSLRAFGCQLNGSCGNSTFLALLFSLLICNLKTLIVHITFSCKWDPFCETIEIVNTSQYSAQRLPRTIFCPTRLDGGCWEDQVMLLGCTGRVRILLRKYCWLSCFDIVLASQW